MSQQKKEPLIVTSSLSRVYRVGGSEVHALRAVDLEVREGEFLAVVGVSGSGVWAENRSAVLMMRDMAHLSLKLVGGIRVGRDAIVRADRGCLRSADNLCGVSPVPFIPLSKLCDGDYKQHYGNSAVFEFLPRRGI